MQSYRDKTKILYLAVLGSVLIVAAAWFLWLYPKSAGRGSAVGGNNDEFTSFQTKLKNAFSVFSKKGSVRGESAEKIDPQIQELRQRVFGDGTKQNGR